MAAANKKLARSRTAKSQAGMFNQRQQQQLTSAFNVLNEHLPKLHKQRDIEVPEAFNTMPSQLRDYSKWFIKNLATFGQQRAQQAINGTAPRGSATRTRTTTTKRSRVKAAGAGGAGPGGQTHATTG